MTTFSTWSPRPSTRQRANLSGASNGFPHLVSASRKPAPHRRLRRVPVSSTREQFCTARKHQDERHVVRCIEGLAASQGIAVPDGASTGHQAERPSRPEGDRTAADRDPIPLMTSDSRREGPRLRRSRDLLAPLRSRARCASRPPPSASSHNRYICISLSRFIAIGRGTRLQPAQRGRIALPI
jgi:hypothetical protein